MATDLVSGAHDDSARRRHDILRPSGACPPAMAQQEILDLFRQQRFAQQEPLNFPAPQLPQFRELVFGFHALGHHVEAEIGTHTDHRLQDHPRAAIGALALDERLVDLDLVERKSAKVA
jgi:hypothetical protein